MIQTFAIIIYLACGIALAIAGLVLLARENRLPHPFGAIVAGTLIVWFWPLFILLGDEMLDEE